MHTQQLQEIRENNEEKFKEINEKLEKYIDKHIYKHLKVFISDIYYNSALVAMVYNTVQTFEKLGCSQSETKHTCDDNELRELRENATYVSFSILSGLLALELLWTAYVYYKKKNGIFEQNKLTYKETEKYLFNIKNALIDVIDKLFMTHQLTIVTVVYLFFKRTISTGVYVAGLFVPSLLLAILASPKAKALFTCFTPGTKSTAAKNNIIDFIQGVYMMAGQAHFILTIPLQYIGMIADKKIMLPKKLLYALDAGIGLAYGSIFTTKNCVPYHRNQRLMKLAVTFDNIIAYLIRFCMLLLIVNTAEEQKAESLGVFSATCSLIMLSVFTKQIISRQLGVPIREEMIRNYQQIQSPAEEVAVVEEAEEGEEKEDIFGSANYLFNPEA